MKSPSKPTKSPHMGKSHHLSPCSIVSRVSQDSNLSEPSALRRELQIIEDRYIDDRKLVKICLQRFGPGNYSLEYKLNNYYLHVPEVLHEDVISQCEIIFKP
ncbi:hypothetical protein K458DRAFT_411760 [Lentithecium fluviatile CBS 122367]|uniref:Uncharacterized protein n=1 Tax=Lentithecium fluviatile CBS 122367 TaxID=1168545 RepID=A0A6G1JNE4_9PLEO|nr:hypothetical protein K458DRAFT_411760 [Lentithecium fluviatile CBS 122367]